ncbi:hypothetical protein OF83DRAFT_1174600 [Amylostereum chailletii]|nr:hypothetical protein OF83DRAFT_1174600 [Amylostereum chailletii]
MSYIAQPHRSLDGQHLSQFHPMVAPALRSSYLLSSYDHLHHSPHPPDHLLPKLGETRCCESHRFRSLLDRPHARARPLIISPLKSLPIPLFPDWSLLSADLRFIYLDPVLAHHLADQADLLIGQPLIKFVHPEEQATANRDLGNVLDSPTPDGLIGSVTRMRFSRLSRVRRLLGYQGPLEFWGDADKVAIDANYMAVDIIINWAADGLVFCFLHASTNLSPLDDDKHFKSAWSNWCETKNFSTQDATMLCSRLYNHIPQNGHMYRVFQIITNTPERHLLLTWPPDQQDKGPCARDFARLSHHIELTSPPDAPSTAKTTCTNRFKVLQSMTSSDGVRQVESSIIFACHKVCSQGRSANMLAHPTPQQTHLNNLYTMPSHHQYLDTSFSLPAMQNLDSPANSYLPQSSHQMSSSQYQPSQSWTPPPTQASSQASYSWSSSQPSASFPVPSHQPSYGSTPQWTASQSSSFLDSNGSAAQTYRPSSPQYAYASSEPLHGSPIFSGDDPRPGVQRRESPGAPRDGGVRAAGNPPTGVVRCSSCKVTHSPEWRKGPSGKKDLCNACGLRYARSRAKKEGVVTQRRRRDKVIAMTKRQEELAANPGGASAATSASAAASASSMPISYSGIRRDSYSDSYVSNSPPGSTSGNEGYSTTGTASFTSLTPSPSPPSFTSYRTSYGAYHSHNSPLQSSLVSQSQAMEHSGSLPSFNHLPTMAPPSPEDTHLVGVPSASYERESSLGDVRQGQRGKATFVAQ